jgi:GST-like protein
VIVDHDPAGGGAPHSVFESGAILQYLAEKSGKFLGNDWRERSEVMQWLFWQVSGLGPIGGQAWHFLDLAPRIAPEVDNTYACNRYFKMFAALWKTMNRRLEGREFLGGNYSIADMACYPWIVYFEPLDGIGEYPNVRRWRDRIAERPGTKRAYAAHLSVDTGYERTAKGTTMLPWEGVMKHVIISGKDSGH